MRRFRLPLAEKGWSEGYQRRLNAEIERHLDQVGVIADSAGTGATAGLPASVGASFGDGNNTASVVSGQVGYVSVPYGGTIDRAQIVADVSCTANVEVWKAAGAVPTVSDKISASAPVTLSAASYSADTTLTGWTTAVSAGDVFGFKLTLTSGTPKSIVVSLGVS